MNGGLLGLVTHLTPADPEVSNPTNQGSPCKVVSAITRIQRPKLKARKRIKGRILLHHHT
jgi:hypothetical protein